ncbi:MAG: endolytic transglycosylase MltG [Bacteroidales bacterium]|nr:endolytic transglycosylase MltG [Bacteroidales bacterium]MBP5518603.1 endolytic transglycosylase MltG [Bacteroidales bacterium]
MARKTSSKPKKSNRKSSKKGRIFRWLVIIFLLLAIPAGIGIARFLQKNKKNVARKTVLYVRPETDFNTLMDSLEKNLTDIGSFVKVANREQLPSHIHPGRYVLDSLATNIQVVRNIKYGYQTPLMLPLSGRIRHAKNLAARLGKRMMADSAAFMEVFTDNDYLQTLGTDTSNVLSLILPDSYEFYWTATPKEFLERMKKEYDKFWTDERLQKAKKIGLSPKEVSILASIVYGESNHVPEYPKIASVYHNRLRKGWKLCADPTVIYATGDFTITRVLKKHLETDSPYNTYKVYGLPPGPIMAPTKDCIDGVLNEEQTDYYYFCANPKFNGTHRFARNEREHFANARAYRQALDSLNRAKAARAAAEAATK